MPDASFFQEYKLIFIIIHLIGFALGLGGATIGDTLFFRFLKDLKISKKESEALHIVSMIIWSGLIILTLSGIGVFLSDPEGYLASSKFISKIAVVAIIAINGVVLHFIISPRLIKISWAEGTHAKLRRYRKLAFACGAISAVSWYSAFILGAMSSLPFPASSILTAYTVLLFLAVTASQMMERIYSIVRDSK